MDVDGEDDDEIGIPKASKKKIAKTEDTKSKKEHVNVVFIGHVGKCWWHHIVTFCIYKTETQNFY